MTHATAAARRRLVARLMVSTAAALLPLAGAAAQTPDAPPQDVTQPISAGSTKGAPADLAGATTAAPATGNAQSTAASEIIVTGSRIRGAAPVGSTVTSITTADIAASGATTTTDLIQQVPQVFNLGVSETSRGQSGGSSNITYGSSVNLRGIGPYTTLTIVDGHRVVPQGTSGFAVDPSVIPTLGLERVEIVADGASAIYGSDAVAGVVNLILRRNFEGVEVNGRYGFANDYSERQLGLVAGHRWDTGQLTVAFENGFHSALSGLDRGFYRGDLTARGGNDFRVTLCNPGTITVAGTTYPIPAGGVTAANRAALVAGAANRCDNAKIADLLPRQDHYSASATFNQTITGGIKIFADGFATRRNFKFKAGAAASTLTVPSTNAFFVAPPGTTPASETVAYSFINDYPQSYSDGYSESFNVTGGVDITLPFNWKLEGDYSYGEDRDLSVGHNVAYAPALTAALASANAATAFNPFGGGNSQAVIGAILSGINRNPGHTSLRFYEAKIDGPLFRLPGGEVRAALGYEGQDFHVNLGLVNGSAAAPVDTERFFSRQVNSGYGELLIPLFGADNETTLFHKLEIDAAVRYDTYSDVGHTTNPKVGVNWSPVRNLTLRGSYGTSFRAPTISQIYGNTNSLFVQNYSDPTTGTIRQGVARSGANLNLKPETARTFSVGADYDFGSRAKIGLTYFDIDYTNQVTGYLSDLTLLQREAQFAGTGIIVRNPSAALIAQQVAETGFTGVLPSTVTLFVDGRNNNLGKTIAKGLDFQANYRLPTDAGTFSFAVNGTYFLDYKVAIAPSAPLLDQLNLIFNPIRFRARGSAGWAKGPWQATAFLNFENAYTNNLSTLGTHVRAYKPVDLYLAYNVPASSGILKGLRLSTEIRNLFDEAPPFVNIAQSANGGGGFDPTLTNPVGRIVSLTLDKKF